MNVADMMTASPVTIRNDSSLRHALQLMEQHGCRHLPVISADNHLTGIVSDRDCRLALNSPILMRQRWQDEAIMDRTTITSIMTAAPIVVEPNTPAAEAARLMIDHAISALPVMRGETLVGIVTTSDILMAFVRLENRVKDDRSKSSQHSGNDITLSNKLGGNVR